MALAGETILAADALTGAWSSWTPSWTAVTSNPSLGNGTLTGSYKQVGKTVFFNLVLTMGSTTTYGTGLWQFSIPVAATEAFAAPCSVRDNSAGINLAATADGRTGSTATAILRIGTTTGSGVNSTTPFTWAQNDVLKITGTYQST